MEKGVECILCEIKVPRVKAKRIRKEYYCSQCESKKRRERRHLLKKIWEVRKVFSKKPVPPPKIKGQKPIKKNDRSTDIYLRKNEKYILFQKYTRAGMSYSDANRKIKEMVDYLDDMVQKLRQKKKPTKEIVNTFKEEFARMCEDGR